MTALFIYICIVYFICTNAEYMYAYCYAFTLHMDTFNSKGRPVFSHNIDNNWKAYVNIVQLYLMDFFIFLRLGIGKNQ